MRNSDLTSIDGLFRPAADRSAVGMTDAGLVFNGGSLLVRMRKNTDGRPDLAIGADRDRMLAMLSIAHGRPVIPSDVMPHVETAADLWRRGDKALANLRLMFAGLPGPSDPTAGHRVALAAYLLDNGWAPAALLEELGLTAGSRSLEKYNPNHVPAGHGRRSGQFDVGSGTSLPPDSRIVVAGENEKDSEVHFSVGETTIKEEEEHHRLLPATPPIPAMGGAIFERPLPPGIGPGPFAGRSVPAGPSARPSPRKQSEVNEIGRDTGCHTCGTKDPGTPTGNFYCDHQYPTSLNPPGQKQVYFPHCLACSCAQGGLIKSYRRNRP